jgi:glycosyltransferase involved in cell wall biosynthesis
MPHEPPNGAPSRPEFLLVLPAFRELRRLPPYLAALSEALAGAPFATEVLVVDDGSPRDEQEALRAAIEARTVGACTVLPLLVLAENRRKGDAILEGWRSRPAAWLAFADADGATAASEVRRVFGEIADADPGRQGAHFGVRNARGQTGVRRTALRWVLGALYRRMAALALRAEPMDFQCGFKVVPGALVTPMADALQGRGFCFDLALFLALRSREVPIHRVPIRWADQPGGSFSPWRNGPGLIAGLWNLAVHGLDRPAR